MTINPDDAPRRGYRGAERPLGEVLFSSNRLGQASSMVWSAAADNLLIKAVHRLERDELERAEALVTRALRLPYDEHEEVYPATWSARMMLFMSLSNDLEDSDPGDTGWLDRAEQLLPAGGVTETEIRADLRALLDDMTALSAPEVRRLKVLTRGLPLDVEPLADVPLDDESRLAAIIELLRAVIEHRRLRYLD